MNPEAILGIKKAASKCSLVRSQIIKELQSGLGPEDILNKFHRPPEVEIKIYNNGYHREINSKGIINFHVEVHYEHWREKCCFSYHKGNDPSIINLIEINKNAVIETARELCPGLPITDISNVIDMYKEDCFYLRENSGKDKSILKAGDIIHIDALFALESPKTENIPCAFHQESVLITGNGSEILTRN